MSRILLAVGMVASIALGGCALAMHNPSIGDLQRDPAHYMDRSVNVEGQVTTSWGVPLVPFLAFGSVVALFFGDAILDAYLGLF